MDVDLELRRQFDEYQDETGDQYRHINTNVSIRLSSPGNDGPVTQTNLAISTGSRLRSPFPSAARADHRRAAAISVAMPAIGIRRLDRRRPLRCGFAGHAVRRFPAESGGRDRGRRVVEIDTLAAGQIASVEPLPAARGRPGDVPAADGDAAGPTGPPRSTRAPPHGAPFATPAPRRASAAVAAASSRRLAGRRRPDESEGPRRAGRRARPPPAPATAPTVRAPALRGRSAAARRAGASDLPRTSVRRRAARPGPARRTRACDVAVRAPAARP